MKLKLHWQILIAMVIGLGFGLIFQNQYDGNPNGAFYNIIISLGLFSLDYLKW